VRVSRLVRLAFVGVVLGAAGWALGSRPVQAWAPQAASPRTVWSGVYTEAQAARGKEDYEVSCAACHGPDLGGGDGPALVGDQFLRNWLEDDVNSLFRKIHDRMPGDGPGTLPETVSLDITAYIMQANEFPAGANELALDAAALSAIRIEEKTGPGPVPNFSLVKVVGCLAQDAASRWVVTRATEPVRARETAGSAPAAITAAPLGSQTFSLMDAAASGAEAHKGEKVEVKGLLMRGPAETVLNVTSLLATGSACPS
jgi:mono/diheme cytochrome c family protein